MVPVLIPFKQVGIFVLGQEIIQYLDEFEFEVHDMSEDQVAPSINYIFFNPEMTLFVLDKKNDFIGCYEELLYKGVNLIGLSVQQFSDYIEDDYSDEDKLFVNEEEEQYVYEFDKIGLQVWTKGKLGVIVSIMVNRKEHYID
ncbi:hypothetical protein [Sphingobacterium faecium]